MFVCCKLTRAAPGTSASIVLCLLEKTAVKFSGNLETKGTIFKKKVREDEGISFDTVSICLMIFRQKDVSPKTFCLTDVSPNTCFA